MVRNARASAFVLSALAAGTLLISACDRLATEPEPTTKKTAQSLKPQFDDDSTTCLHGYIVVNGRVECL